MDIWHVAILIGVTALATYTVIRSGAEQRRKEQLVRKLFVYAYQIKDCLVHLVALQDYGQEVSRRLPWIGQDELERIEKGLVKRSMALSTLSYLQMEKSFDFIRNNPLINVALQREDRAAIDIILETTYGSEYGRYDVDLSDEKMAPILKVLKELTDSK